MSQDRLTCPYCDRTFDLDQVEAADLFRERNDLAAKLGKAWWIANEYVDCFRRQRAGRISLKKRARILREVVKLWESGVFEFDGKRYRAGQGAILAGFQAVCNRDMTGLENHNYLKRVLMGGAERLSAEGLTAREEQDREQTRLFGRDPGQKGTGGEEALAPAEIRRRAHGFLKEIP